MRTFDHNNGWATRVFGAFFGITLLATLTLPVAVRAADDAPPAQRCRAQLLRVRDAITSYRLAHKDLPPSLDALVPDYLPGAEAFRCPEPDSASALQPEGAGGGIDPEKRRYLYLFESKKLAPSLPGNPDWCSADLRRWQMGLLGSAVPLLRCPQHRPVLNLAVAGQIYESGADWTQRFWPLLPEGRYSLEFEKLAAFTSLRVVRIPQRASDTPAHLIDLTRYFNASLEEPWTENAKPVSLSALGGGVRVLDGVPFDVRGVIQLRGGLYSLRHFPPAASNITVGLRSAKLHFLHATTESARRKDSVAQIIVHYPDHAPVRFDFRYAVHLLNLRSDPHRDNRLQSMVDTRLAWSSPEDQPPEIHLYHTEWNNPHPELEISRIDYVSGTSPAGPVLLAITADPPPSTTMPSPPSSLPTNPEPRSPSL